MMSAASSELPQRKSITKLTTSEANDLADAFKKFKDLPANDPDSFWTIAGYHGEPYPEEHPTNPGNFWGYCHHGTVLFPTWHRAYLHRIEAALKKVHRDPNAFRLPYWDVIGRLLRFDAQFLMHARETEHIN
jgi:Common central domain of tyrosinase